MTQTKDNKEFSAIVAVKNRYKQLLISLQSWIQEKSIKEIIVVDWSSSDIDHNVISQIDPRIKLLIIDDQEYFHFSKAYSVALQNAKYDYIIKFDADYILNPYVDTSTWMNVDFETEFLTGDYHLAKIDNDAGFIKYLNGFMCCKKSHMLNAGGYKGNKFGYGNDDTKLYEYLEENMNLTRKTISIEKNKVPLFHMPHEDPIRTENYENKDLMDSCRKNHYWDKYNKVKTNEYNFSKSDDNVSFNLVLNLHQDKDIIRSKELIYCLKENMKHPNIKQIHILGDKIENYKDLHETMSKRPDLFVLQDVNKRCSYRNLFDYCNQHIVGNCIIANSDVVLRSDLNILNDIDDNKFLCISRWEYDVYGDVGCNKIVFLGPDSDNRNFFSHDAWIFKSPMLDTLPNLTKELNIGTMFCDSTLNWFLEKSSYECYNLAEDIIFEHVHKTTEMESASISEEDRKKIADKLRKITGCKGYDFLIGLNITSIKNLNNPSAANNFTSWTEYSKKKENGTNNISQT